MVKIKTTHNAEFIVSTRPTSKNTCQCNRTTGISVLWWKNRISDKEWSSICINILSCCYGNQMEIQL